MKWSWARVKQEAMPAPPFKSQLKAPLGQSCDAEWRFSKPDRQQTQIQFSLNPPELSFSKQTVRVWIRLQPVNTSKSEQYAN